ncbi:hypothetical protein AYI69_g6348 [Smittium culicis]|uniref:Uncharacterized protein n=1 Tax=Smittium culicis TaxID=133412 RepID=A0A1R1XZU5_9FUNG|nr:hypothetical protein AYI69_g6348 [Smittium culicis]
MEYENYVVLPPIVDLNSIGSEEETKEMIQACPISSTMNYSPPLLNENIIHAAKKTDTNLYCIQSALAQATRPLINFFCRKYNEDSEAANEDEILALASAMILILASIATKISQSRMENVYQDMNIPGKPKQLAENAAKLLFDQKLLDKAMSTIKPAKKSRLAQIFKMRQQHGPYRSPFSSTTTAQTIQSGQTSENPTLRRGFPPEEGKIAGGDTFVSPGTTTVPVQSTAVWPIALAAHLYQGTTASTILSTKNGDQNSSLLIRPPCYRRIKRAIQAVYHHGPEQAHTTWAPGKLRQVGDSADTNDKSPSNGHKLPGNSSQGSKGAVPVNTQGTGEIDWKSSYYVCSSASRSSHAEATLRTQELLSRDNGFMEIDGSLDEISGPKPSILELPVLPLRDARDGGLH